MKQTIRLNERQLRQIVTESVKRVLKENIDGNYFDLDQTTDAYSIGGKNTHWTDYSTGDSSWDENNYYEDFDGWWNNLPDEEKERIYSLMKKH